MGSFFVRYFLEKGDVVRGADPGKQVLRGPKFRSFKSNAEAVKGCDLTIIAVPIDRTLKVAKEVAGKLKANSAMVEISSVKGESLEALKKLTGDRVELL